MDKWNYFCILAKEGYFYHNMREFDPSMENISLTSLIKKPFKIMNAQISHVDQLVEIEENCWENNLRIDKNEILFRIENFPDDIWIAVVDDAAVGVLYTQRVSSMSIFANGMTFSNHRSFMDRSGSILQLITIAVKDSFKDMQIGQCLRDFMLFRRLLDSSIVDVVAITRCSSFRSDTDYVSYVLQATDPTLRFHCSGGATIRQIIPNYRPEDSNNLGNGILISYSQDIAPLILDHPSNSASECSLTINIIRTLIEQLLDRELEDDNFLDRPFMALGLDSLRMQELASKLLPYSRGKIVSSTLLFDRPTPRDVLCYFEETNGQSIFANLQHRHNATEYAIVGMSCRFPMKSDSPESFFQFLSDGTNAVQPLPLESWGWNLTSDPDRSKIYSGATLDDISSETFDEKFFGINSSEIESIDPHHRLLLELSYEALSQTHLANNGVTGVYVGMCNSQWNSILMTNQLHSSSVIGPYAGMGVSTAAAANRISYHLNLTGPSIVIDTACSSSLVAVDQACMALSRGDCDTAIVTSADLILSPYNIEV